MTKKHFILLAQTIAKIEDGSEREAMIVHNVECCSRQNPRFSEKIFREFIIKERKLKV